MTGLVIVAVIGTGWVMGSAAMQWLGFVMLCAAAVVRSSGKTKQMTPQQAADELWRDFQVRAEP